MNGNSSKNEINQSQRYLVVIIDERDERPFCGVDR
jgi:hypothetical protein